jgi:hypothetical protein
MTMAVRSWHHLHTCVSPVNIINRDWLYNICTRAPDVRGDMARSRTLLTRTAANRFITTGHEEVILAASAEFQNTKGTW